MPLGGRDARHERQLSTLKTTKALSLDIPSLLPTLTE
jgi:hypothetical protein